MCTFLLCYLRFNPAFLTVLLTERSTLHRQHWTYKMEFKLNGKYLLICVMNTQIYDELIPFISSLLFVMGQVMWRDSSWVNLVSLPLSEKDKYLLVYLKHITYPQLMCINNNIHFRQPTRKIDTKSGRNLVGMSHMCEQNIFEGTSSSSKSELLLVSLHYINDDKMSSSSLQKYITSIKSSFVVFPIYYMYTLQCMGTI